MTTLERRPLAAVITLLVGLWHALAARTLGPQSGPVPGGPRMISHRMRPCARRNTRRAKLTRRTA